MKTEFFTPAARRMPQLLSKRPLCLNTKPSIAMSKCNILYRCFGSKLTLAFIVDSLTINSQGKIISWNENFFFNMLKKQLTTNFTYIKCGYRNS